MNYKKYISLTIFTILFAGIIFVLFYNKIIYPTIWPVVKNNTLMIFHDWSYVVNSSLCFEKGYDVYLNNPCETLSNPFIYGKILLYLPFVENNLNFYYFVVPIVFNIIFLFVCLSFFYKENKLLYLILSIIFIFSVPFLLAIERANIDILIALIIFLLAKFKNIYLNIFFIIMISISKFYPICLNIIFIFNKNLKSFLKYFFLTNIIILSFLFFQKDSLIKIFNNKALVDSSGIYNFSFSGILESSNNVSVLIILLYLFIFLLFTIFFSKKILSNNDITRLINSNIYENRLFILSSTTLIFCYFVFSNYIYREIFFLGLIPWILKNNNNSNNNLPALLLILLSLKFILTTLIVFINLNNILPDLNIELVILKHFLDFLTILPLINILLILSFYFFKEIKVN
mgnify:FL=1